MTDDRHWRKRANCLSDTPDGAPDPGDGNLALFFSNDWRDWRSAKAICAECPVRRQCLENAIGNGELWGVWGGIDQYELRRAQALDKNGYPRAVRPELLRCPFCFSKDLATLEKRRIKAHISCNDCGFQWWRRRVGTLPPTRKETKKVEQPADEDGMGDTVSAGS